MSPQVCNVELAGGTVMTDDNKEVYCSSCYDQYDILIFLIMSWQYLADYLLRNATNVRSQLFQSMAVIQRQDWELSIRIIIQSVSNVRWNIFDESLNYLQYCRIVSEMQIDSWGWMLSCRQQAILFWLLWKLCAFILIPFTIH